MSFRYERVSELFIEEHISSDLHFHTVRVWFVDDPLMIGIGTAARNPEDKYNAHKGYKLALRRALIDVLNNAKPKKVRKPKPSLTPTENPENTSVSVNKFDMLSMGPDLAPRLHGGSYGAYSRRINGE